MKTKITLAFIVMLNLFQHLHVNAQTTQVAVIREWTEHFANQDSIMQSPSCKDVLGNYYVTGYTLDTATGADIVVIKYDKRGNVIWSDQFSGTGYHRDQATAICLDDSLNVYVAGFTYKNDTSGYDIVTIRWNANGTRRWEQYYRGTDSAGSDVPVAIGWRDSSIYVTGGSMDTITSGSGMLDVVTLKYKKTDGTGIWGRTYDYVHLYDAPRAMQLAVSGIIITGASQDSILDWDYLVLRYAYDGTPTDTVRVNNGGSAFDRANAVGLDSAGNAYVTGRAANAAMMTHYNIRTAKVNPMGAIIWTEDFDLNGFNNEGTAMDIDGDGNIYITGYGQNGTSDTTADYVTLKYDSAGNLIWSQTFNGSGNGKDVAWYVDVDSIGTVYATGETWNGSNSDFGTIAYDSSGSVLWQDMYDGDYHGDDKATHIEHDGDGIVYVSGQSQTDTTKYEYITIQYDTRHFISPPDTVPCPGSFAFYANHGQIIDSDDSVRMDVKYYTVNNYPNLYFFKPSDSERLNFLSYVFTRIDTDTTTADTLTKVDLTFELHQEKIVAASDSTKPFSVAKNSQGYLNYFLPHCPNGITGVEGFNKLLYPDVFDYTDILFTGNNVGMKFYIIVKPGGEYDVGLNFDGQDSITIVGDTVLNIYTSIATYSYPRPDVFQIDANGDRVDLAWQGEYVDWGSGRVGFNLQSIDGNLPFVIEVGEEPEGGGGSATDNLKWCMYYGGEALDNAQDVANDDNNNMYVSGITHTPGSVGNPLPTLNALYTQLSGQQDAFIIHFNKDPLSGDLDTRKWATYYGGSNLEYFTHIAIDGNNDVYLCGSTQSNDVPLIDAAHATFTNGEIFTGSEDVFLVKFKWDGQAVIWGNYFNDNRQSRSDVAVDRFNNVYLACHAQGTNVPLFQATANTGAYYQSNLVGQTDITVCKMSTNYSANNVLWCTHFSATGYLALSNLHIQKNGSIGGPDEVYIFGQTSATFYGNTACGVPTNNGFPQCNPGSGAYFQAAYGGGVVDAFITEFQDDNASSANDNQMLWSTYFGGATGENPLDGGAMSSTKIGGKTYLYISSVVVANNTGQLSNFPAPSAGCTSPCYNQSFNFNSNPSRDIFIAKFIDRVRDWTTFYGGVSDDERPYSIAIDGGSLYEHAYLLGTTSSSVMSTDNCIPPSTPGDFPFCDFLPLSQAYYMEPNYVAPHLQQAFITAFNTSSNGMEWSSYFGHDNGGGILNPFTGSFSNISLSEVTHQMYLAGYSITLNNTDFPIYWPGGTAWNQQVNLSSPLALDGIVARFNLYNPITGINDNFNENSDGISVYPNPSQNLLTFEFNSIKQGKVKLTLYDVLGRSVYVDEFKVGKGRQKNNIDISNLSPGVYLIKVDMDNYSSSAKFLKD